MAAAAGGFSVLEHLTFSDFDEILPHGRGELTYFTGAPGIQKMTPRDCITQMLPHCVHVKYSKQMHTKFNQTKCEIFSTGIIRF